LSSGLLSKNIKIKIHRTVILPVVLYGCDGWFLIFRHGHKLRMFEDRVLRRTFGPRRDEMTGERSRLHIKQPYASIYFSSHIIRVIKSRSMRWARHVKLMEKGEVYTGF